MDTYAIYYFVENNIPFYIGLTRDFTNRMRKHRTEAFRNTRRLPKYHKLKKMLISGIRIEDIMIPEIIGLTKEQAINEEIRLIKYFQSCGVKLYNLTEGGEGCAMLTPEGKERLSKSRIGRKFSEETRQKISKSRLGMKFSDTHKANLSKAWKNRVITEETKQKISLSSKGKINIKIFTLIDPNGTEYITTNGLTKFCEEHNLGIQNMHKVIQGIRNHHKGWRSKNDH